MRFLIKCRGIAAVTLGLISFYSQADWKMPREALDRRLVQAEFRIHYTLTGENAFPLDVPSQQRAQQAAEQLSRLVSQIDQASHFYREQLGLTAPLSSARYRDMRSIDVHIIKLKGKMGSTGDAAIVYHYKYFAGVSPALTITLSNQWRPPNLTPNHEVFHAYQYAYTFFKNPWYLEGMARSMESAFKKVDVLHTQALPRDHGQLEQVLTRSYGADLFWNRLMYFCDSVCSGGNTPAKAWNGVSGHFCGGELVRSTLEQFQAVEKEAARIRGIDPDNWPENEQRSDKNNPFLLRGLRRAIESQCQLRGNPELEAFHRLLERY